MSTITDVDIEQGQMLIELPCSVDIKRVEQVFWRIGLELAKSSDKDVCQVGNAIEQALTNLRLGEEKTVFEVERK